MHWNRPIRYGNRIWGITLKSLLQVYRKLPYPIPVALGIRYTVPLAFSTTDTVPYPQTLRLINATYFSICIISLWVCDHKSDKKAELSQRRPRDAPNIWVPWKIFESPDQPTSTFPEICNGRLFRSILRTCVQNWKFCSFTRSWDNRGYSKNLGKHWIRPRSLFSQMFTGLLLGWSGWTRWIYLPNWSS